MSTNQKIAAVVGRFKRLWALSTIVVAFITFAFLPGWFILFLIPYAVVTYFFFMTFAVAFLQHHITPEEMEVEQSSLKLKDIHERLERGELEQGPELIKLLQEAGMDNIQNVKAVSDEIVGFFNGNTMYEWVEVFNLNTKQPERFMYHGPAPIGTTTPELEEEGKVFATVDGIIYVRDVQS